MKGQYLLAILCFWSSILTSFAQEITEEKLTKWHHFQKNEFKMDGVPAWYVIPENPLSGNPWVWRAHFPNWHTEIDSILLEKGFHIAYINTNDLYGHSSAMNIWDRFYSHLVQQKKFAQKVALEGVSRGGLYVFNWAKRNPSKVSCIYVEAPVCDFRSWPYGIGEGEGSEKDWKKLLQVYGFTEEEALNYKNQPKDNLEALAAFKVPILHAIGLNDKIVPPDENTFILVNNYLHHGGPASIIPMTKGEQRLSGHHFPIEKPDQIADFIYKNSTPVLKNLQSEDFIQYFGDLNNSLYKIEQEKEITIAFLGGSITNMKGWRDRISIYLEELYPNTKFNFINAGVPSLGSLPHAFRLQTDVLDKGHIDLMFIESAVNDHVNGTTELQQRRALEGIIRHAYTSNPEMDIIMMAFVDENKIDAYKTNKIPLEVNVHRDIAKHYNLPFINLAEEVSKRIFAGEFTWQEDFKNLHPSPFGQEIYFATIKKMFQKYIDYQPLQLIGKKLPNPLHKSVYINGKYISIDHSTIKNGFFMNPFWTPGDEARTRSGFVNLPVLEADKSGSEIEFKFEGNMIGLAVLAGPDAGIIHYSIDGAKEQTIDLFTQWSSSLHLPWYIVLGDGLSEGKHNLKLKISKDRNKSSAGTACRIVNFLVNN